MKSSFRPSLLLSLLLVAALPLAASGTPPAPVSPGKAAARQEVAAPATGPESQRVRALLREARDHREEGRMKEAAAVLAAVEPLVPAGTPLEGELRLAQAELELAGGKLESALARVERALTVVRRHPDAAGEAAAVLLKARALYALGCRSRDAARDVNDVVLTPRALRQMGQAMSLLETVATDAGSARGAHSLGEREQDDFTALWLSYGMPFAAFKWTQKFKTWALRSELTRSGNPPKAEPRRDPTGVKSRISGAPQAARIAPALSLDRVGEFLPSDTMLLEYTALEGATIKHSQGDLVDPVVCFRVETGTGEPTLRWGGLRSLQCAELRREVELFRGQCATEDIRYAETAQRLYRMLLAPIEDELRNKKRLIICADGPLQGLPFHALMKPAANGEGFRFLIEEFEIVYAYSASAAGATGGEMSAPLHQSSALVICDPTQGKGLPALKFAAAEETAIRDALPLVRPLRGAAATEAALRAAISRHGLVHFAGHTVIDGRSPWKSGLLLAPSPGSDGILSAVEILEMRFSAGLVVLSSCRTAGVEGVEGSGLSSLAGAIFAAGARSQVLTLWEVVDESAPAFMRPFYAFLANRESRAGALRGAARKMLESPRSRHPRFWAPFVLWGDWR